jgi:CheY-like chemotaxis protein
VNVIQHQPQNILLADDDMDDCMLFEDALREICTDSRLVLAHDGVQLLSLLQSRSFFPDVIFLDLNMPLKNGFECLNEIRQASRLKNIPVVILSTCSQADTISKVYSQGATHYIPKPDTYSLLKKAISVVLAIDWRKKPSQPSREKFILHL